MSGRRCLSRRATARLGTFCMDVVLKPTSSGSAAIGSSTTRSQNVLAYSRIGMPSRAA